MEDKGFFGALFDISFSSFITPKIISVLFVIFMILSGLAALVMIITGFMGGIVNGLVAVVLSPIVVFLYILFARIWLELVVVMFKIAENTDKMVEKE